ncbi:lipoyltransferase 1, mitochondrial-like [Anthonomus grandis grandis]|uniref:lipoyltransferase 1, mitochondrial-like n=1 Tax=Anthonomus grandis grandis TaxID=2921223 RepID=UPI0021657DAC|nr:lipoyltransferase 1, mitochondrial-like [Anthonomus grandis grandis]
MALMQHTCNRFYSLFGRINVRAFSKDSKTIEKAIKKSVFISQSNDVYMNLALEEWLFKNFNFKNHHVLMLWQNDPCVVIGRHQNPWSETNISDLHNHTENGIYLARRSGNGGSAYNDNGTLNMTFFTTRERYNAQNNTEVVARSIFREFDIKTSMGSDENLLLRGNKQVSNKGAKIGRDNSYHSMSLMVKSNKVNRNMALQKHDMNIRTKATTLDVPTNMMNLCEENPQVNVASLIKAVGWEFLRTKALTVRDGGMELAYQQKGFQMINPTENWFPGLNAIREKYSSWDWCYGKTPKFNITQAFKVPGGLVRNNTSAPGNLHVTMTVENGRISDITIYVPNELNSLGFTGEAKVIHSLKGKKFSVQAFDDMEDSLGCLLDEKDRFVTECLKQMACA